jgi:hypothetical protein
MYLISVGFAFQPFRCFLRPACQIPNIENQYVKDSMKSFKTVPARSNAVESLKPPSSPLGKRIFFVRKSSYFVILSEAEQPGELVLCLVRDCATDAASI